MHRVVLVIEDDPIIRQGMTLLIKTYGHAVVAAGTVAEGMDRLADQPTHVLLDMNLPDGVGTTILRHVRAERLPIRVAVLSGSGDAALMAEARSLGPDAVFRKPADLDAVMDWIAT